MKVVDKGGNVLRRECNRIAKVLANPQDRDCEPYRDDYPTTNYREVVR